MPSDPILPGLRVRLGSRQGYDTLCLPVGEIRGLVAEIDRLRALLGSATPTPPEGMPELLQRHYAELRAYYRDNPPDIATASEEDR